MTGRGLNSVLIRSLIGIELKEVSRILKLGVSVVAIVVAVVAAVIPVDGGRGGGEEEWRSGD